MSDIYLRNVEGIARLSGTCEDGCTWTEYSLDEPNYCDDAADCDNSAPSSDFPNLRECQGHGDYCEECNAEIYSGWVNLDGGEVVCKRHVHIVTVAA